MKRLKQKYLFCLLSSLMVLGGGVGALLYYMLPTHYPHWYFGILAFVFVLEVAVLYVVCRGSERLTGQKLANLYMAIKGGKLLLSLLFVGAYMLMVRENVKNFVLVYLVFYLFYVLLEIPFYAEIEQRIKNSKG